MVKHEFRYENMWVDSEYSASTYAVRHQQWNQLGLLLTHFNNGLVKGEDLRW